MSAAFMRSLAKRHGLDAELLIEVWEDRAAAREYHGGFRRQAAELFAIGDVEQLYSIGLHCPESLRRWTAPKSTKDTAPK